MFTGIVEQVGYVEFISFKPEGRRIGVSCHFQDVKVGDSVAVNGVCLTVVSVKENLLEFDVSYETLRRSNLGSLTRGMSVNLERALQVGGRLGGHILYGHVDFCGKLRHLRKVGDFWHMEVEIPTEWSLYFVEKGSVGIDGISLTVNEVREDTITITVVPHTYNNTNLKSKKVGDLLNVEVDVIGKYIINYIRKHRGGRLEKLIEGFLGELL
ncbi:riboflavin synthase, alpha subunit [Thermocrinis albus DSM 14484]|uniref:Riboflavin synthase n=1 Tax=Thermocrinis albus (strain DSM 14484 / JCM 11386 / HI 11/12) TaxID=638303 RepID=D3SQ34_THEAH|nr:riboflavin synthase [Thermocrinis albus]ADC89271.1 riboflavin synthase, alpha subunit [Thermocrinis albus DSM 14484]